MAGNRYYFPDEEPEDEYPYLPYSGCDFCGHETHKTIHCPSRPPTSTSKPPKRGKQ